VLHQTLNYYFFYYHHMVSGLASLTLNGERHLCVVRPSTVLCDTAIRPSIIRSEKYKEIVHQSNNASINKRINRIN
jgi:hypothetical protein